MRKLLLLMLLVHTVILPAGAAEITAPGVPEAGAQIMPEETESFGDGLVQLLRNGIDRLQPDLRESVRTCVRILTAALLYSLLQILLKQSGKTASMAAVSSVCLLVFQDTDTLIRMASDTVFEICEYGKLLCPVMTAALAGQGAVSASSGLYMGTLLFLALLGALISRFFVPMVYAFLVFSAANSAFEEEYLRKFADSIKSVLSWLLKTLLLIFTTYMSITGVVAGTTDAAALKAAKVTISTAVPVVGGVLSDASEAVLVGMGLMKNAAGIYGILAALAIFLGPFLKVGMQYLSLKLSASLCSMFAAKNVASLVNDLSTALGLLLSMLASACTMVLISTVCFLKGAA